MEIINEKLKELIFIHEWYFCEDRIEKQVTDPLPFSFLSVLFFSIVC